MDRGADRIPRRNRRSIFIHDENQEGVSFHKSIQVFASTAIFHGKRGGGGRDSFNSFLHHCQLARVARRAIRGRENTAIHGIAAAIQGDRHGC